MIPVFQSWDDGVEDDIRLAELCRRHGACCSFNLNPGLHGATRGRGWMFGDKEVRRLARAELAGVYDGFEIANHTMTHPDLAVLDPASYRTEIADARTMLQDWFGQPVEGFCYPFGRAVTSAQRAVEAAGHRFARGAGELAGTEFGAAFRLIEPDGHFLCADFQDRYERAIAENRPFFFWGHSYEIISEAMWQDFDRTLARITADPRTEWTTLGALAAGA